MQNAGFTIISSLIHCLSPYILCVSLELLKGGFITHTILLACPLSLSGDYLRGYKVKNGRTSTDYI